MFFGLFQPVEYVGEKLRYRKDIPGKHIIYGYLQVETIVTGEECRVFCWHPHAANTETHNTMYIASEELIIDGEKTGYPGYGTFNYSNDLVLSKEGYSKSKWDLPSFLEK